MHRILQGIRSCWRLLRHRSQSLRWGREILEEMGSGYGEVDESFLDACDENEEEG